MTTLPTRPLREIMTAWQRAGIPTPEWPICRACGGYTERGRPEPVCPHCQGRGRNHPGRWWRLRKTFKVYWTGR